MPIVCSVSACASLSRSRINSSCAQCANECFLRCNAQMSSSCALSASVRPCAALSQFEILNYIIFLLPQSHICAVSVSPSRPVPSLSTASVQLPSPASPQSSLSPASVQPQPSFSSASVQHQSSLSLASVRTPARPLPHGIDVERVSPEARATHHLAGAVASRALHLVQMGVGRSEWGRTGPPTPCPPRPSAEPREKP